MVNIICCLEVRHCMTKVETLLQDSWVERVSFILLVNKLMELQGRSERFDVNCDLNITDVVKFAIRCTRK